MYRGVKKTLGFFSFTRDRITSTERHLAVELGHEEALPLSFLSQGPGVSVGKRSFAPSQVLKMSIRTVCLSRTDEASRRLCISAIAVPRRSGLGPLIFLCLTQNLFQTTQLAELPDIIVLA